MSVARDPRPLGTRLRDRMEDLRAKVPWSARAGIAAIAVAMTLGTWGPMLTLSVGLPAPSWERLVHHLSGPYCHQLPERSYHVAGHIMPLCTRCTGMWLGITVGVAVAMFLVPKSRWWIGSGLAVVATAMSAFDRLREDATGLDAPNVRFLLGILIFAGVTLAVSYDSLAVLLGILRALRQLPGAIASRLGLRRRRPV